MPLSDGYHEVQCGKVAAVVTSLQMIERPAPRPDPREVSWTLHQVKQPDLDWYRDLFRRIGEDWLWFSRLRMTDEMLRNIVHHPRIEVHSLQWEGRDEGLLELDFREKAECELGFFGVTAPLIGTGAGRWLMNRAIQRAWSRPLRRFWVHTCTLDHPGVLDFYVRSGFIPYRRQIEIADDPRLVGNAPRSAAPQIPII
jgi:GNAT superfamily N-acetyltransferase